MKANDAAIAAATRPAEDDGLEPHVRALVQRREFSRKPVVLDRTVTISFEIPARFAPALRSAVEEISNRVGGRLEGSFPYATQDALTDGAVALGVLRKAVNAVIPRGNPDWRTR